jgi:hypothetical protein
MKEVAWAGRRLPGGDGDGGGSVGAVRRSTSHGTGRACSGERIDAAVERFVSFARRFEPVAHGVAAHEARSDFLAGEVVEKPLLIGDWEMAVAWPRWRGFLSSVARP